MEGMMKNMITHRHEPPNTERRCEACGSHLLGGELVREEAYPGWEEVSVFCYRCAKAMDGEEIRAPEVSVAPVGSGVASDGDRGVVAEVLASHRIRVDQVSFFWFCSCGRRGEASSFALGDASGRAHVAAEVVSALASA